MIISIASGKGGTGKTTVATNLAASLAHPLTLLDCDVEEPNVHLFLPSTDSQTETISTFVPKIDGDRCTGCGICVDICQFNALAQVNKQVLIFPELCHSCRGCELLCPEQAVTPDTRELGSLSIGHTDTITIVQGRLRVGEAMAPPLIKAVRGHTREDGLTIIDAPPGTSCPMIASVRNSDFVLFVSEPTPFGLHDLELALGAVRQLDIPCGLVINRADIGDSRLVSFAEHEHLPILLEIPFSRDIAKAYSTGELLIEALPHWRSAFQELFDSIQAACRSTEVSS